MKTTLKKCTSFFSRSFAFIKNPLKAFLKFISIFISFLAVITVLAVIILLVAVLLQKQLGNYSTAAALIVGAFGGSFISLTVYAIIYASGRSDLESKNHELQELLHKSWKTNINQKVIILKYKQLLAKAAETGNTFDIQITKVS